MDSQAMREEIEDSLTHIVPRKPFPQRIDDTIFLEVTELLSQHPDKLLKPWSENPRLYTLLRMLGYQIDSSVFHTIDITDFWLPLAPTILDQLPNSPDITSRDWYGAQRTVLSKPELMNEDKFLSHSNEHRYIRTANSHFEEIAKIGVGGSAEVTHVRHKLSGKQFACKRIIRAENVKSQRDQLIEFEQELGVLKRISHRHTVMLVGSFTDFTSFSLILSPVAKDVLKSVLERQSHQKPLPESELATLRQAFGCLATALAYLHEQKVRHKDIKPGNILLSDGRVYLCDFGISRDWSKDENSTTEGDVMKFTRRYCAPEVVERDPRNTKSDIWSLGCVYMEMISIIKGYTIEELNDFFLRNSDGLSSQGLWRAPEAISAWLVKLKSDNSDSADNVALEWITPMIRSDPAERLKSAGIVSMIHKTSAGLPRHDLFIASCCARVDSIAPIDSPTLHDPTGLGIKSEPTPLSTFPNIRGNSSSPSPDKRSEGFFSPRFNSHRSDSPRFNSHRSDSDRDRTPSPHTQSFSQCGNSTVSPLPSDTVQRSSHSYRPHERISSSNSERTSSILLSSVPSSSTPDSDTITLPSSRRQPVEPPATHYELKCGCRLLSNEKHIFNSAYSQVTPARFDRDKKTMQVCSMCEIGDNRVQIYESAAQDPMAQPGSVPMLWWVTKRLVISYISGDPEMRHCNSFWVPLADLRFELTESTVKLSWSDCNQMTQRSAGNYQQDYEWVYDPNAPNNAIEIPFNNTDDAQQFIAAITLPFDDDITVTYTKRIQISDTSEIDIFDVGRPGVRNYRAATLKNRTFSGTITSKFYVIWPEIDLRIENTISHDPNVAYEMEIDINNINTPTYLSDTIGEPAADYDRVAHFSKAHQIKTNMVVRFPVLPNHRFPAPPPAAAEMLQSLTGWTLSYFAIVSKFRSKNRRIGSKRFGRSDVMLWEKEVDDRAAGIKRRGAAVTFRLHEDTGMIWVSGKINASTTIEYSSGLDATVTVANKSQGRLLIVSKMVASESENPAEQRHSRGSSHVEAELSDLVVTFENSRYRLEFVKLVEEYRAAATDAAPSESMRRVGSLASSNDSLSPPMR
ncbi:unnamed protein product [Periconia digitata]|uniref:Protein kinase domain-containing protein n=1 Tax=Periconia digitata TaxID=1303443 RepID=A0A9W4U5U6_9PLEO|nr:unnamed protein product [Periconia digitata]